LFVEAGFPGGKGFPPIQLLVSANSESTALGEVIQQQWRRELGVNLELVRQESKVRIDAMRAKDYQVGLAGLFYGIQAPEFILMLALGGAAGNDAAWRNVEFDAAFGAANQALTVAERHAAYDRMEELVRLHAPYAPLYFENMCHLVHPDVHGWRDNALYAIDWRDLWLERAK
jgi:oligopeptide transport system substrate-binding protein